MPVIHIAANLSEDAPRRAPRAAPRPSRWRTLTLVVALTTATPGVANEPTPDGTPNLSAYWTRERKAVALNAGIVGAVGVYGITMWGWGETGFEARSEGWFGRDTRHGGADKLGHAYTGSVATALGAALYRRWGYDIPLVLERFGAGAGTRRVFEHIQIPGTALPLPP